MMESKLYCCLIITPPQKKQTRTRLKKHVPVDVNWWTHSMCPSVVFINQPLTLN